MNELGSQKRQALILIAFLAMVLAVGGIGVSWSVFRDTLNGHYQAGVQAYRDSNSEGVAAAVESLRKVPDYAPHMHLLQGMLALQNDHLSEAVGEFGLAHNHPDTQSLALLLSGETLFKMGRWNEAERFLITAVSRDPNLTDAHRWLSKIYAGIGATNQAIIQLQTVADQDPNDPQPHRLMGSIYHGAERLEEAKAEFRESLRRDPDQPQAEAVWCELAECLVKQTAYDQALKALAHCTESAQTKALQAECYHGKHDDDQALELVAAALDENPNHLGSLRLKATLLMQTDDLADAVEILKRAVHEHPCDYGIRYQLAVSYERLGKQELASSQINELKRLEKIGQDFDQMQLQAIKDPTDAEARFQLGELASQLGKPALAQRWFRMTLAMDPRHERARQKLDSLSQMSND